MVKKTLSIILGIFVLAVSLNIHLDFHYCHDELTEVSFSHQEEHCGGLKKGQCSGCKDVHITLENEQDQVFQERVFNLYFTLFKVKTHLYSFNANLIDEIKINDFSGNNSSPPHKLYKLYSRYCFYG